jgi:hypothetical protein
MATAPTYCTHRQLKDVFPQVSEFDNKSNLYGWVVGSNLHQCHNSGVVTVLYIDGNEVTATENTDEPNANGEWRYIEEQDVVQYYDDSISDMNDRLVQSGEDFATLITRITANASRYLDAKLDPNLPKEQYKDKEGNFDYIIVRTAALIAATFLIRSHDPTSEIANSLMEDAQDNIDALNKGGAALSWQTTGDSSKGVIRDVSYTSGSVRPVDTRGRWSGSFDLIRVKIETGGAMDGTATYSVWVKDGDKLGNQQGSQVVTSEKINGDYQSLAGGLQIRFGGSTKTSVATATNEWEIEVAGWQEEVDNSTINSVRMTRR